MKKHILAVLNNDLKHNEETMKELDASSNKIEKISLLYIVPTAHWASYLTTSYGKYFKALYIAGKETLEKEGKKLNVNKEDQWLKIGFSNMESKDLAKKIHANQIIGYQPMLLKFNIRNTFKKLMHTCANYLQRYYGRDDLWGVIH